MPENSFIQDNNTFSFRDFELSVNNERRTDISKRFSFSDAFTLDNIQNIESIQSPKNALLYNVDYSDPKNYVKYSSFSELIRFSIEGIILNIPASLYIQKNLIGYNYGDVNIFDISYNASQNITSFSINTNYVSNPFQLNYSDKELQTSKLSTVFQNYEFEYENVNYSITAFETSSTLRNDKIRISVSGKPFDEMLIVNRIEAYIKPNAEYYETFKKNNFNGFQRYMLRPSFKLKSFKEADGDVSYSYYTTFSIPKSDRYNYDFFSKRYERFLEDILTLSNYYDENLTNVSSRLLIPENIQDITLRSDGLPALGKSNVLINTVSSFFDTFHTAIQDFKTNDFYDYESLNIKKSDALKLMSQKGLKLSSKITDNELALKALLYNAPSLLNMRGTRAAIDFMFSFLGIPEQLIEFNEHVYETKKVDYEALEFLYSLNPSQPTLSNVPVTKNGTPYLSKISTHFQSSTYFSSLENLLQTTENNFVVNERQKQNVFSLYENDFNVGDAYFDAIPVNPNFSGSTPCYSISGSVNVHSKPEIFFDECGCPIDELQDLAYHYCAEPIDIYDGQCRNFIIDVVPNCIASEMSGGTITGQTQCEYSLSMLSDNGNLNSVSPSIVTNGVRLAYTAVLVSDCEIGQSDDLSINATINQCYENTFPISASGYVSTLRLYDSINNAAVDLDLNPFTTPHLNGCGGVLTADELLYPTGATASYEQALNTLLENAICNEFSTLPVQPDNGANYIMSVEVEDGYIKICFNVKHQPTSPDYVIGINKNDALFAYNDSFQNYVESVVSANVSAPAIFYEISLPCFSGSPLTIEKSVNIGNIQPLVSVNYNQISLSDFSDIAVQDTGSNSSEICLIEGVFNPSLYDYGAEMSILVYGGFAPYEFFGLQDGQYLASGQTYSVFAVDASGCTSNVFTGEVLCNIDTCLGTKLVENTRTVTTTETVPNSTVCAPIDYTLELSFVSINSNRLTLEYNLVFDDIDFNELSSHNILFRAIVQSAEESEFTFPININSTNHTQTIELNYDTLSEGTDINFQNTIFLTYGQYDCQYSVSASQIGDLVGSSPITINGTLSLVPENIEIETTTEETYFEVVPNQPVVQSDYECELDNQGLRTGRAIVSVSVSGGTEDYDFYGALDGEIVDDGQTLNIFVIDATGCKSNIVELQIDCESEQTVCEPIEFRAELETTQIELSKKTATLTISYFIDNLAFDVDVQSVNIVASAVGQTINYMIGSPSTYTFTTELGAEKIFFEFDPDNNKPVEVKFYITIELDNGCVYTDIFNLSADAGVLSSKDIYEKTLN